MQKCKMCEQVVEKLCWSDIIPAWCWTSADSKHRIAEITIDNFKKMKIRQGGIKEYLLCQRCETKLSVWEKTLKRDFIDIANEKSKYLNICKKENNMLHISPINYNHFKKAILSIFWRLSVAKKSFFNVYTLGVYEEKIRHILNQNTDIPESCFPLNIYKILPYDIHSKSLIVLMPPVRMGDKFLQNIVIFGLLIEVGMYDKNRPSRFLSNSLRQNGDLTVHSKQLSEIFYGQNILNRFKDKDVKQFIKLK